VGKWPGRSTLHLIIPDGDDPFTEVRRLTAALAPGSFLAVTDSADGAAMWADVARGSGEDSVFRNVRPLDTISL